MHRSAEESAEVVEQGYVVHYAAWKHHIGLYPIPALDTELEQEVSRYRAAKDTMRIPLREPIPHDLLGRLVTALAKERAHMDDGRTARPGRDQRRYTR